MAGNIRAFSQQLNAATMLNMQSVQNSEKIPLSDTVPAGSRKMCRAGISNYGDFLCLFITGVFDTLNKVKVAQVDHVVDDGVNYLRGQLSDSIGQRKLFTDYIPFTLWVTPGRRKSSVAENNLLDVAGVANQASPGNQLFYPEEFEYIWASNAEIIVDVFNDSAVDLTFDLCFHGIRILSETAVAGVSQIRQAM